MPFKVYRRQSIKKYHPRSIQSSLRAGDIISSNIRVCNFPEMEADNVNNEDFESHSRRISFDAVTQIATI